MSEPWLLGIKHLPFNVAMRDARRAKGWTLQELAIHADLGYWLVCAIERLVRWPTDDAADLLSMALDVPADVLFPGDVGASVRGRPARPTESRVAFDAVSIGVGGTLGIGPGHAGAGRRCAGSALGPAAGLCGSFYR